MNPAVLQKQLRNAGESVGGTGELLLAAADEISQLKTQATKDQTTIRKLQAALQETDGTDTALTGHVDRLRSVVEETRATMNTLVVQAIEGYGRQIEAMKTVRVGLSEEEQRAANLVGVLRAARDEANKTISAALKQEAG